MRFTFPLIPVLLACASAFPQQARRDIRLEDVSTRHALVIGNDAYPKWPLKNPVNDARAMSGVLAGLGFKTDTVLNTDLRTLEQSVDRFIARIRPGDVALFFYAGHGIQLAGENYLVPVDFNAKDEADAKYVSYSASRVHERMENAGARLNLIILDACRNNPFRTTRSGAGGLAAMNTGRGTLIAFATSPGKTADDNPAGSNGLFTSHLMNAIGQPGLSLDQVFNRVREKVYSDSRQQQLPWTVSSVIGEFFFSAAPTNAAAPSPAKPANPLARQQQAAAPQNPLARPRQAAAQPLATELPVVQPPSPAEEPFASAAPASPPADATALVSTAQAAFERGDYEEAARQSMLALRQNPGEKDALFVLAGSQYKSQQYEQFASTALQALKAGAALPFLLAHHHTLTGGHHAMLSVTASTIGFSPLAAEGCNQQMFEVPIQNLMEAKMATGNGGEIFLNVRIRDDQNKVKNFNFADGDSQIDSSSGLPRLVSPPKAARALQSILMVLQQAPRR